MVTIELEHGQTRIRRCDLMAAPSAMKQAAASWRRSEPKIITPAQRLCLSLERAMQS